MAMWLEQFVQTTWFIVLESAVWIIISLFFAGLIHEFIPSSRLKKFLNGQGPMAMGGAVAMGALLPICSCGVIPISVGLYRAGVRIGPVMAFTAATPIINPAAVILSFALLGPQIALAYLVLGLILPFIVGLMSERFGDRRSPEITEPAETSCCGSNNEQTETPCPDVPGSIDKRVIAGLRWGFFTLGPSIGFYLAIGIILAGVLMMVLPPDWSAQYLSANSLFGLLAAALLGASIYVCAVAHIPLVATLLAAGAGPGAAIVFLVTGTATNLPELFALYKTIGRRTVVIYTTTLILASLVAGVAVNLWLGADFVPVFNPMASLDLIETGESLWLSPGPAMHTLAAYLISALASWGLWLRLQQWYLGRSRNNDSGCCGSN